MGSTEFNPGDKVVFKTWEEMKQEFGLTDSEYIDCEFHFTSEMEEKINKGNIYTISRISGHRIYFEEPLPGYSYSTDMIKHYGGEINGNPREAKNIRYWEKFYDDQELYTGKYLGDYLYTTVFSGADGLVKIIAALMLKSVVNEQDLDNCKLKVQTVQFTNPPDVVLTHYRDSDSWAYKLIILRTDAASYLRKKSEYMEETLMTAWGTGVLTETEDYIFLKYESCKMIFCIVKSEALFSDEWLNDCVKESIDYFPMMRDDEFNGLLLAGKHEEAVIYANKFFDFCKKTAKRRKFDRFMQKIADQEKEYREETLVRQVDTCQETIESLQQSLKVAWNNLHDAQKELSYYRYTDNKEGTSDFIAAVNSCFDDIVLFQAEGRKVRMHYKQPLLFFDDDNWALIREGFLDSQCNSNIRGLVDAIFARRCTLLMETGFEINLERRLIKRYDIDYYRYGVPNPHIHEYDCWGDNKPYITQALNEGKNDIAFEQIKSSLAGINVTDSPVMRTFVQYLRSDGYKDIKCITDNITGAEMTLREARDFYKNYDASKEVKEEA